MALVLTLPAWQDVARLADGLVEAAEACERTTPMVARAYLDLANRIADGLDALPDTVFVEAVEEARERRAVVHRQRRIAAVG